MMTDDTAISTQAASTDIALPEPATERWQPLRSGLLNLYRYDYEEFRFEQGRLLLRGNNGTGKSRVLALQLPFLFDGEVSPHRIEPDGDSAKRIEWNLLMGRYPDRLGYTWIEFGRLNASGQKDFITLGIGLYAVEGRGAPDRWYFVTKQRVGRDLFLQSVSGNAITAESLADCIGAEGHIFTAAKDFRRAVDQALFKLGEQRYRALIDLLIQLRQPQLSRDLDERKLSTVLSEALPPVSPQIIADVAESFKGLESDRQELERFQAAGDSVEAFLREYRRYARIAARRRSEAVRLHHSAYEGTQRRLKAAKAEKEDAVQRLEELESALAQLQLDERGAAAEVGTLENSPQMRGARDLEAARKSASERLATAEACRRDHQEAVQSKVDAEEEKGRAIAGRDRKWRKVNGALESASSKASTAGMATTHEEGISLLDLPDLDDADAVDAASELLDGEALNRRRSVRHVRTLESAVRSADNSLSTAKQVHVDRTSEVDAAVERQRRAQELLDTRSQAHIKAYREWAGRAVELSASSADLFAESFRSWCETGSGRSPMAAAVHDALAAAQQSLASEVANREQELEEVCSQIAEMEKEQDALRGGRHEPPAPPYTRSPDVRTASLGGAFWSLIEFQDDLPPADRAGLEAALEASGILDAWVSPDGKLVGRDTQDIFIDACVSSSLPAGHLGRALRPDPSLMAGSSAVPATVVEAILERIGLGLDNGITWVDSSGSWANGTLRGAWSKPTAQHIGHSAREARRQERMRVLQGLIESASVTRGTIRGALDELARRMVVAKAEADDAPQDDIIVQSLAMVTSATIDVDRARSKATEAEQHVTQCRQAVASAVDKRNRDAKDLGVLEWVDRLQELDDALSDYRQILATLWPAISEYVTVRHAAKTAEDRAIGAATDVVKRHSLLQVAEQQASEAVAKRDTLESTVGAAAEEILARLEGAKQRAQVIHDHILTATDSRGTTRGDIKTADLRIQGEEDKLSTDASERAAAIAALKAFVDAEFLGVATPELTPDIKDWEAVSPAVELARRMESSLSDVAHDEAAWNRNQQGLYGHIQTLADSLTSRDLHPEMTLQDEMMVVKVLFHGRNCSMPELRLALHEEVTARSTLLEKREREVLENTLIGEVATHLHERIRDGEKLVTEMNRQIESRPMSTGMRLRFSWDPAADGPPGLPEARRRLLGAGGVWSPEEREALGGFLHEQIQAVRAANQAGKWQEHLAEALDYRKWHQFGVMRQQDGRWKRLTRRTHGTGSGGEKAVALTIPMFAAAAAHYASADPLAPRLILLDEAFVGIDADMRSKCMGLLNAFGLDFVMTSEREWGCYPTLPGVAIYHLTSREGIDAILATRWVWNGREKIQDNPVLPSPFPPGCDSGPSEEDEGEHG
ncbi:MAG: hypothetical protein BIFFINMI_00926 [Phycisphaerae bacterium]|nr:hypothetical protein [Phycisphaerae bacterium]